mmetsp:Transcript_36591/g.109941  ORF Transcript_36591/g.109941 Transcript_36591/m.109941 type:complete len:160 (-) Transcript_36591:123-602(-)|eukprot:CAMPEP_0113550508 /NCGR_PEP_ID=MMETSP0015_2-20120614/14020_1 /TAXON_ID=2838 /ORGANISM="Odontella" /LENGTH=159 /DNA_ID=CAMNT_0000451321 /DNA_START=151 /DNA_END=630 /DNA_ORIENTATION=- /assembly_acc=CAM_ASM_000160
MGRRAKKAPVQTKKRATLAKRFKCPFCANDNVVECKMDHKAGTGSLKCRLCGASYQMPIHHLHEPVDVFSEWLDDCEAAERGEGTGGGVDSAGGAGAGRGGGGAYGAPDYDDDDDDELEPSSGLGRHVGSGGDGGGKAPPAEKHNIASLGLDDSDEDSD